MNDQSTVTLGRGDVVLLALTEATERYLNADAGEEKDHLHERVRGALGQAWAYLRPLPDGLASTPVEPAGQALSLVLEQFVRIRNWLDQHTEVTADDPADTAARALTLFDEYVLLATGQQALRRDLQQLQSWIDQYGPANVVYMATRGQDPTIGAALHLLRRYRAQTIAAPEPPVADPFDLPPGLVHHMRELARTWQAIEYDAHERPAEIAALRAAAEAAGMAAYPSETVPPRSYRGCPLRPAAPLLQANMAEDPGYIAAALARIEPILAELWTTAAALAEPPMTLEVPSDGG